MTKDLFSIFTKYVKNHKDFKALEKLPTLYYNVEVYPYPMFDTTEIARTTRTFDKVSEDGKTLQSHLWGVKVSHHNQWDTIEKTKEKIDTELARLRTTVSKNGYPVDRKFVLWARRERKKIHVNRWQLS